MTGRPGSSLPAVSQRTIPAPRRTAPSTRPCRGWAWPGPRPRRAASSTNSWSGSERELFVVGAELATAPENRHKLQPGKYLVTAEMVEALEPVIDDVTARFEQPHEFVLPGQDRLSAALDLARTLVRRAERESVAAVHADWIPADSAVVPYLNRLSDLCWTLARWVEGDHLPSRRDP